MSPERFRSLAPLGTAVPGEVLPERTQRLIQELRAHCTTWLQRPLEHGLVHLGDRLEQMAINSQSHFDQLHYLSSYKHLQTQRKEFDQQFIASIDQAFANLGSKSVSAAAAQAQTLSLLDPLEHDLNSALDQLVARSKVRGGVQLIELGYRLAVLMATPPLESNDLPVGPQAMARAFRTASAKLGLPPAHELLLLQSLESSLIDELSSLYALVNTHLIQAGILRGLRPFVLPRTDRQGSSRTASTMPGTAPVASTTARTPSEAHTQHRPAAPDIPVRNEDAPPAKDGSVTDAQLQIAVSALQEYVSCSDMRTRIALNQPQSLREELHLQLNVGRPMDAEHAQLSPAQRKTVDMIVRLFGEIAQQLPQTPEARSLLYDLQFPLLRMALLDPAFFHQREHPAHRVLNKIAEIANDWFDDISGDPDHVLRLQLGQLIEAASRAAPATAVYVALLADIERVLEQLKQETQLMESQQLDAMRGLERLEKARLHAAELLSARYNATPRQRALLARLPHAWFDVLALTLVRNGEDSASFAARLNVTDRLLGIRPMGNAAAVQHELEKGLRQIGMFEKEIRQLTQRMLRIGQEPHRDPAKGPGEPPASGERRTSIAAMADGDKTGLQVQACSADIGHPGADVLRIHRHLRSLPAGRWFEFMGPPGEPGIRRRLAWYSPMTGHSLFVTRRGQRAQELGELKLAQEIACGHIRELPRDRENVIEQAWRIVAREMGKPSGSANRGAG